MPRRSVPDALARAVGRRVRQLREERGLTAEKLAYESELGSKGYLSDIEHGLALPSLRTLGRLADYLEAELLDLVTLPERGLRHRVVEKTRKLGPEALRQALQQLDELSEEARTGPRQLTRIRGYPTLEVAAGWLTSAKPLGNARAEAISLPGAFDARRDFAVRASGSSMVGWRSEIRHGDWLVLRRARSGPAAAEGHIALIAREDRFGDRSLHIKRVVSSDRRTFLCSDDPATLPLEVGENDEVLALLVRTVRPESLAPATATRLQEQDIASLFGLSSAPRAPWSRTNGHLFLLVDSMDVTEHGKIKVVVPELRPAETAFVLARGRAPRSYQYLGVADFDGERQVWRLRSRGPASGPRSAG